MKTTNIVPINSPHSADEVVARIKAKTKAISSCLAYSIAITHGKDSELVGEVNRNRVVLARARPFTHNASKPVLNGVLVEKSGNTVLQGRFEYNCFHKYATWVSSIIFAAAEIFILIGIFAPENQPIYGLRNIVAVSVLPGLVLAAYLFTRFVQDPLFDADAKWIEDELKRLLT